jgi:hypothetical protein
MYYSYSIFSLFLCPLLGELLMPVFLSSKLFFEAAKVGGGAFAVGMKAALATVAANQNPEKRRTSRRILSSDDEF